MAIKLIKACKELNIGMSTAVEFCAKQGHEIATDPNTRIDDDLYLLLAKEFNKDMALKLEAERQALARQEREMPTSVSIEQPKPTYIPTEIPKPKVVGTIDLEPKPTPKQVAAQEEKKVQPTSKAAESEVTTEPKPYVESAEPTQVEVKQPIEQPNNQEILPNEPQKEVDQASGGLKVVGKIDLSSLNQATHPIKKSKEEKKRERT